MNCEFVATAGRWHCANCDQDDLSVRKAVPPFRNCRPKNQPPRLPDNLLPGGVGTELKKLLAILGIHPEPGCPCNAHAAEMDRRGCDWCEENIEKIVGWLEEEATKRNLPFFRFAGRRLVKLAIWRARRKATISTLP
jgi:hypothetical protein